MGDFYTKLVSLSLVSPELNANIETAVVRLEQYSRGQQDASNLHEVIELVAQLDGALRMVQLSGVEDLSGELLLLLKQQSSVSLPSADFFSACSTALFILPRYLEHIAQRRQLVPELLLPQINELRSCQGKPALPDSYFFSPILDRLDVPTPNRKLVDEEMRPLLKRLRHMYQLGLIQLLTKGRGGSALSMMSRAAERLQNLCCERQAAKLWWAVKQALYALQEGVSLSADRKIVLRKIDAEIKQFSNLGAEEYARRYDQDLLKEALYLASLGPQQEDLKLQLGRCLDAELCYSEKQLQQFRDELHGPSLRTLKSVVQALEEELRLSETTIEAAALAGDNLILDFVELIATLGRIADSLTVLGLNRAAKSLKEQAQQLQLWQSGEQEYHPHGLVAVADVLVYVENTVAGLKNYSLRQDDLQQLDHLSYSEAAAGNQLADAEAIVLKESQTGLSMVKRAMSAFVDSGHDANHIGNIGQTLASIRGGLGIIQLQRGSALVASIEQFVSQVLRAGNLPPTVDTLLETLADAIISLEHYLTTYGALHQRDDNILLLGEESMAALGFPVVQFDMDIA